MKKLKQIFKDDGFVPNSQFPVVIKKGLIDFKNQNLVEASSLVKRKAEECGWRLEWCWKIYKKPHYHSTSHEGLIVFKGHAKVLLGGHRLGQEFTLNSGDAILIPAGVLHQCLERTKDFTVFGCYPVNAQPWDLLGGKKKEREAAIQNIRSLGSPPDFL